jgi:hypothetical protein
MMAEEFGSRPPRRWLLRLVIGTLVLAIVLGGGWTWFSLNWPYSEGERAGILQKFSRKGWLCKTYEGELALYIVGGMAPQIWHFSTRDPKLAQELTRNVGRDMRVQYSEHRGVPTNCFAETANFAQGFTLIER